jgi:hypothetical protein
MIQYNSMIILWILQSHMAMGKRKQRTLTKFAYLSL